MAGSDYAHCEHCGQKAFYDVDIDMQGCIVFHPRCLRKFRAQVVREAAMLIAAHAGEIEEGLK